MTKLYFRHHIPSSAPNISEYETALRHIYSQQCKYKQLKRYKAFIDTL